MEENIDRLDVLTFQTSDNSQLLRRVLWVNAELTIVWYLKHKNTQPRCIFSRENPQNSEPQNGPRGGLDFIALIIIMFCKGCEHGCEPDTVQKKLKQKMTQGNKQKQFHIHNHDSNSYKTHK